MSQIWREQKPYTDKWNPEYVWYVKVCSFTFNFDSLDKLQQCLNYYSQKTHPSSRIPQHILAEYSGDHSEVQRWFERLPMYLLEEPKREKVVAALQEAVDRWTKSRV